MLRRVSTILLIEDDAALADVLAVGLEDAGYVVLQARDGIAGLECIARDQPAVVVSDVNMPRLDGFALCRRLRASNNLVPLILLTSRDSEIDQALGLDLGADDYVVKPVSLRVLVARVGALLRREQLRAEPAARPPLTVGALEIDPERLEVRYRGVMLETTLTELRMLEALASRAGRVLSRDRLLELARGDDSTVDPRLVDAYVRRLRRKLEAVEPAFDRIDTVVGAGYRWRDGEG
jgi:DNA-binding response OmpR family regulator